MALLAKNADAETRFLGQRITQIARPSGEIIVNQTTIALHEGERDRLRFIGSQRFNRWIDIYRFEHAEILYLQRVTDRKIEVGDAIVGLQHRREDLIEIRCSHELILR